MNTQVDEELATLEGMTTNELCERYRQLFGQPVRTRHKQYLVRKIAWRVQALAEGDLTERARRRAAELANDADVRLMPPRPCHAAAPATTGAAGATRVVKAPAAAPAADRRLPAPGAALVRQYKGRQVRVVVRTDGFEYEGEKYKTLTAVAEHVTGSHINGFRFFRLEAKA
jgi:hypothetical protein